jgi:hypothetical protein
MGAYFPGYWERLKEEKREKDFLFFFFFFFFLSRLFPSIVILELILLAWTVFRYLGNINFM